MLCMERGIAELCSAWDVLTRERRVMLQRCSIFALCSSHAEGAGPQLAFKYLCNIFLWPEFWFLSNCFLPVNMYLQCVSLISGFGGFRGGGIPSFLLWAICYHLYSVSLKLHSLSICVVLEQYVSYRFSSVFCLQEIFLRLQHSEIERVWIIDSVQR